MPLLSRAVDPLLGVFTGVFAYYLYEVNPRNAIPERDRLLELIKWKQGKTARKEESQAATTAESPYLKANTEQR